MSRLYAAVPREWRPVKSAKMVWQIISHHKDSETTTASTLTSTPWTTGVRQGQRGEKAARRTLNTRLDRK